MESRNVKWTGKGGGEMEKHDGGGMRHTFRIAQSMCTLATNNISWSMTQWGWTEDWTALIVSRVSVKGQA